MEFVTNRETLMSVLKDIYGGGPRRKYDIKLTQVVSPTDI